MKLPDEAGRAATLRHYLRPLRLGPGVDIDALVSDIAAATDGASGADLDYICQTAARLCVKDALVRGICEENVMVSSEHMKLALAQCSL
jgi:ATP-dependent 26S proteasome regulatory subunit